MANTLRYSDEELEIFKVSILKIKTYSIENLQLLKDRLDNTNDTIDTSWSLSGIDDAMNETPKGDIRALIENQISYISLLQHALTRIENKTYGICASTGKLIPKERLKACPTATRIIIINQK
jgi:DnaK suppressor protein